MFELKVSNNETLSKNTFVVSELGLSLGTGIDLVDEADDPSAILRYYDLNSVDEEIDFIIRSVRSMIKSSLLTIPFPWRGVDEKIITKSSLRRREAVMKLIGLNPDGTPSLMEFTQWVWFGSHKNYLKNKINTARRIRNNILYKLEDFSTDEEDNKDTMLMQYFILEQLPLLQRLALRSELFQFDMSDPPRVNGYLWLLGWMIQHFMTLFMIIWVLLWAVDSGETIFESWLYQFFYSIIQEVFVSQVILIFIVHVFTIEHMQPQLKHISHTLNLITLEKMTSNTKDRGDIRAVQHLSGACRVSRDESIRDLPSSILLQTIDDEDVNMLRRKRSDKLSYLATLLIGLPVVFGLGGEKTQSILFDIFVACVWGTFLFINHLLLARSVYTLIGVYIFVGIFLLFYICIYRPRSLQYKRKALTRGSIQSSGWKKSEKVHRKITPNPFTWIFKQVYDVCFTKSLLEFKSSHKVINTWKNMNSLLQLHSLSRQKADLFNDDWSDSDESEKNNEKIMSQERHPYIDIFALSPQLKRRVEIILPGEMIPNEILQMRVQSQPAYKGRKIRALLDTVSSSIYFVREYIEPNISSQKSRKNLNLDLSYLNHAYTPKRGELTDRQKYIMKLGRRKFNTLNELKLGYITPEQGTELSRWASSELFEFEEQQKYLQMIQQVILHLFFFIIFSTNYFILENIS